jgi:hypothetical protein
MNRRDFVYLSATGLLVSRYAVAAGAQTRPTTPLYVRGLAMVKFNDADYLQVALPSAPHHAATISTYPLGRGPEGEDPLAGEPTTRRLEGHVSVRGIAPGGANPGIRLPEVIQIRELYPGSVGNFEDSPTVISIPWTAVRAISADILSEDRWTFVWADSGDDVLTFRPRKVAESIRIDVLSEAVLHIGERNEIPLGDVSAARTDFVPEHADMGDFTDHFSYYMPYIETPGATRPVEPQKVGAGQELARIPAHGNAAFGRMWPIFACFVIEVD